MRPTPRYLSKLGEGAGALRGGGGSAGVGGGGGWGVRQGGGVPKVGGPTPTTTTCIPPGGMCVWGLGGYGGMYVNSAFSSLPGAPCLANLAPKAWMV